MASYYTMLSLHLLGATIWAGGHLALAIGVLPNAWRQRNAQAILDFEGKFERVGIPALIVQVITGLWLADHWLPGLSKLFTDTPVAHAVQVKLGLLLLTAGLAINARLRVIPNLTNKTVHVIGWHIIIVTTSAVLFVLVGATVRNGGYPFFD